MVFGSGNKFRIKRSQSKASYLSAYKREPREREKGLPNFEGSYKRTASPNNSAVRGADAAAATTAVVEPPPQDVENVAPDGSDFCNNVSDTNGGGVRLQSLQENNNCTTTTSQQQQQQLSPAKQQMSPAKQQAAADAVTTAPAIATTTAVLSERSTVDQQHQQQQQLSKTLPRVNNSTGQDFKRSSRTPRTQSDPSNMPSKADAAMTTLHMMMMPPPRHSESASSLQKRSQSDLSQVGSTESGYSSLSLNVPSPSHSPTRLSSGDYVAGVGQSPSSLHHHSTTITTVVAATTITTAAAAAATSITAINVAVVSDLDECAAAAAVAPPTTTWRSVEPPADAAHHQYHRSLSSSCSVVSSDAASQTDLRSSAAGTPLPVRRKSPEEIECDELSRDLISHLSPSDKLHNILAPGPDVKRSTDYVSPLFRMELAPRSRTSIAEKLVDYGVTTVANVATDVVCDSNVVTTGLSPNSSYYTTSEPKARLLNHFSRQRQQPSSSPLVPQSTECNGIGSLQKKKADLVSRLDRKLKVLRDEKIALIEETAVNETLGETVANRVKAVAKLQEANKFKTHVQEVGHITSLLLSLSGRLARVENALLDLGTNHVEKKALEEKKSKLTCQLEEAKELKENIDRRGESVSNILSNYLTPDEYSDYDHFIAMKAKLLIDGREIVDKIQLGEEQLRALKETLED